jgi:hypothetical protein
VTAISRSLDHRYTYDGQTYPGVTGILKILDKSGPLMSWASRQTAEAAIDLAMAQAGETPNSNALQNLLSTVGREGTIKAVTSRSAWKNDEAKDMGTRIHELTELLDAGQPTGTMTPSEAARVEHYREWVKASGWDLKIREAAYGMAELIQPVDATAVAKMPKPDRYAILHVTATGVREIEIPISDDDRSAFLAAMDLTRWADSQKGRAL